MSQTGPFALKAEEQSLAHFITSTNITFDSLTVTGDLACTACRIYSASCLILKQTPTRGPMTHTLNPADSINYISIVYGGNIDASLL